MQEMGLADPLKGLLLGFLHVLQSMCEIISTDNPGIRLFIPFSPQIMADQVQIKPSVYTSVLFITTRHIYR